MDSDGYSPFRIRVSQVVGTITGKRIAAGTITADKMNITELSALTANAGTITAGTITGATIQTAAVGTRVVIDSTGLRGFKGVETVLSFDTATGNLFVKGEIKNGSTVPASTITGLITNAQLEEIAAAKVSGKLTNAQIESIEAAKITGTITETQIGPGAISTPKLKAEAVTAATIAAGAITTGKLAAESITAEKIGAGQITTAKIAAGAITAEKLTVVSLSAIAADLGTITSGAISAVDITLPQSTGEIVKELSELSWDNHEKLYGISPTETEDVLMLQAGGVVAAKDRRGYIKLKARKISAPTGWIEKTLINGNSESDFLQLTATSGRRIAFFTATLTYPGGSQSSNTLTVNPGLGSKALFLLPGAFGSETHLLAGEIVSATEVKLRTFCFAGAPPAGTGVNVTYALVL